MWQIVPNSAGIAPPHLIDDAEYNDMKPIQAFQLFRLSSSQNMRVKHNFEGIFIWAEWSYILREVLKSYLVINRLWKAYENS